MNSYYLREIEKRDIGQINTWRNDRSIIELLGNNFIYIANDLDEAWYENYVANRASAKRFSIICQDSELFIGNVQLTSIHPINKSAEFSIVIGNKDYWSKGAGKFATKEALRHGFHDLNLNRIWLTVLDTNSRAIHLYQSLGFVTEGIQREALYKNGAYCNLMFMSILAKEYFSQNS
ncbi:MAG: GNAT family N-acetyltransferase [Chitinophagaceae bacterium]|nr:GNAT family N-acetyltransferase [Chitinophagaceae bacterium]